MQLSLAGVLCPLHFVPYISTQRCWHTNPHVMKFADDMERLARLKAQTQDYGVHPVMQQLLLGSQYNKNMEMLVESEDNKMFKVSHAYTASEETECNSFSGSVFENELSLMSNTTIKNHHRLFVSELELCRKWNWNKVKFSSIC